MSNQNKISLNGLLLNNIEQEINDVYYPMKTIIYNEDNNIKYNIINKDKINTRSEENILLSLKDYCYKKYRLNFYSDLLFKNIKYNIDKMLSNNEKTYCELLISDLFCH